MHAYTHTHTHTHTRAEKRWASQNHAAVGLHTKFNKFVRVSKSIASILTNFLWLLGFGWTRDGLNRGHATVGFIQ